MHQKKREKCQCLKISVAFLPKKQPKFGHKELINGDMPMLCIAPRLTLVIIIANSKHIFICLELCYPDTSHTLLHTYRVRIGYGFEYDSCEVRIRYSTWRIGLF